MEIGEVFRQTEKEKQDELKHRVFFLRRQSMGYGHWSTREIAQFCIDWNEATGKLLSDPEKRKEADKWRKVLKYMDKTGVLKK